MKAMQCFLMGGLLAVLAACSPLHRGFEGTALVSPAQPDVTACADGIPLLAQGRMAPFVKVATAYQFPETYLAVYGKDSRSPMAIVAMSLVPDNRWEWDPPSFSGPLATPDGDTDFGGEGFYGTIRIINGEKDPFSPLVAPSGQWETVNWLAQRYVVLEDFRKAKLILEYREPLPASLHGVTTVPLYDENVRAFQDRARKAFQVRFGGGQPAGGAAAYLDSLNGKYVGTFLGSMAPKEFLYLREE